MKKCNVYKCFNEKIIGDNLFCRSHREYWRNICNQTFGDEKQATEPEVIRLYHSFIQ